MNARASFQVRAACAGALAVAQSFISLSGHAQDKKPPKAEERSLDAEVDAMRTPSSPAFVLLDVAPAAVERPSTPNAFAVSLLSAFKSGDTLPKNYALETAPYWLFSHPDLTYGQYFNGGLGQTLLQTLSLSLVTSTAEPAAATDSTSPTLEPPTRLGVGLRAQFASGRASQELKAARDELRAAHDEALLAKDEADTAPSARKAPVPADRPADRLRTIALKIQRLDKERVGFLLEGAGALAINYDRGRTANAELLRWGVWLTGAYRLEKPRLEFLSVGRFQRDAVENRNLIDWGIRQNLKLNDLGVGGEYVHRWHGDDKSYRLAGIVEYQVQPGTYVTATFGRNFENGGTGNLISILGLNVGLGNKPLL